MRAFTVSFYYDGPLSDDDEQVKQMFRNLVEQGHYWVEDVKGESVDFPEE